ncbi:LamG domain-containing protein [Caulobacter endophyticus]|uniref:LamG domain-containing protein n=1 Tax=Caulobacter endophyticus TaxID=2172652 RepID=UPI001E565CA5|nr:LamG domain-containing protein [Caulobacter endophyticus]
MIGAAALSIASLRSPAALAAPQDVVGTRLETRAIRAIGVETARTDYQGRAALRATALESAPELDRLVVLDTPDFGDGVIEAWISGAPSATASATARGFVGVAFRVHDEAKLEAIYVRPTNGRAEDQLRRNHAVQYISHPDHPWERLRAETPAKYETYVDLEPGRWTHVRIVVAGAKALLHVDGAVQPTLIVGDLKHGANAKGAVALWIGPGTLAHFSDVRVTLGAS